MVKELSFNVLQKLSDGVKMNKIKFGSPESYIG